MENFIYSTVHFPDNTTCQLRLYLNERRIGFVFDGWCIPFEIYKYMQIRNFQYMEVVEISENKDEVWIDLKRNK